MTDDATDVQPPDVTARDRLAALRASGLLDSPVEEVFERFTRLAGRLLDVPVSLVSLVDADRQFFKSQRGLPEPWASRRETPLSHSFCRHVVADEAPLVIEDAREHPRVRDNLAIQDLGVVAYLGVPLHAPGGEVLGSLCAIDSAPRAWSEEELATLRDLVAMVETELALRDQLRRRHEAEAALREVAGELERRVAARTGELRERNRELAAFNRHVAHDLRTPLRGIDGYAQVLLEDHAAELDPTARAHLRRIRRGTARLGELIDDLLELAEVARGELERRPVDLAALAETTAARLRAREPERTVTLEVARDELVVQGDPRLLRMMMTQLLENAWTFTRRDGPARIEVGRGPDGEVFVRDDGDGFDMRYADKLFEPFQRLHPDDDVEGTGIGLALVQRIARRHGGRVWAEGAVGEGATFRVALPAPAPD